MAGRQGTLLGFFTEGGKVRPVHAPVPKPQHATGSGPTKLELPKPKALAGAVREGLIKQGPIPQDGSPPKPKYTPDMEPWQVPREVWLYQHGYDPAGIFLECSPSQFAAMSRRGQREYLRRQGERRDRNQALEAQHEEAVLRAYFEGKPVPEEVLDDYRWQIKRAEERMAAEAARRAEEAKPLRMAVREFSGRGLKRDLGLRLARSQWSNPHKDGSGNFGFVLVGRDNKWYTLSGEYDSQGRVTGLRIGPYGYGGRDPAKIPRDATYREALRIVREYIEGGKVPP